jgi:hypothetical protein
MNAAEDTGRTPSFERIGARPEPHRDSDPDWYLLVSTRTHRRRG